MGKAEGRDAWDGSRDRRQDFDLQEEKMTSVTKDEIEVARRHDGDYLAPSLSLV